MKTVTILGATGSVGSSTLDLIEREPERFQVLALTANTDVEKLAKAAIRTNARRAVVADETCLAALRSALAGTGIETAGGAQAIGETAAMGADWTMAAIVGCAGLEPVMAAVEQGGTQRGQAALVSHYCAPRIRSDRCLGELVDIGVGGEREHLEPLRLALDQIEGRAADRPGRAKDGNCFHG